MEPELVETISDIRWVDPNILLSQYQVKSGYYFARAVYLWCSELWLTSPNKQLTKSLTVTAF